MNTQRQEVSNAALTKVPSLSLDSTGDSNLDHWQELLVRAITPTYGSHVVSAITDGIMPIFKTSVAPKGSSKDAKKRIIAKNEDICKQEITFYKDCDKAVGTIMSTISQDSLTRLKEHVDYEHVRNKDGLINIIRFMSLVRSTHQMQDDFVLKQAKKEELYSMKQGEEETIMVFLERVKLVAKAAFNEGGFDQAKFMPTFIKNCNAKFKSLPTEEIFDKTVYKFLQKIDDGSMPEEERTLFKLISTIEQNAIRIHKLSSNFRGPSSATMHDSSGTAMVASQNSNGKNTSNEGADNKLHCNFCANLPDNGQFKVFNTLNPGNHTDKNCYRRKKAVKLLAQSLNADNNGDNQGSRSPQASKANEGERDGKLQNRKRNLNDKKNNNNKKRQVVEGSKNAATPNGKVFATNAEYAQDDEEIDQGWITTEDHLVLSVQSEARNLNDPYEVSVVVDSACDKNMFNNKNMFIGELQKLKRHIRMNGIGNGSVIATQEGPTIFGKALYTPDIPYNLLSHPQMVREGAIDSTRIKYHAAKVQGALDSYSYPDIYGNMREFAPIPDIPVISKLYQHVYRLGELN